MKKAIEIFLIILFIFLVFSFIIMFNKISKLEKSVQLLKTETSGQLDETGIFYSAISDLSSEINELKESLQKSQTDSTRYFALVNQNTDDILEELSQINGTAKKQYSQTVNMKETYDSILAEQKKKTIDTAEKDSTIQLIKKSGLLYYESHQYGLAFEEYRKVLEMAGEDFESRSYKMKSLYYMNKADSTKYKEILDDINILINNGYIDDETLNIEKAIMAEKGGLSE